MVTNIPQDGQTPLTGRSPTIQRLVTHKPIEATHHNQDGQPPTVEWSPTIHGRIITHHLQDGQLDLELNSSAAQLVQIVEFLMEYCQT